MENLKLVILAITWLLWSPHGTASFSCPKRCKCSTFAVKCINAGLKTLPTEIPSSIRYLDLSENPFANLRNDSFARFTQLEKLILRLCSLDKPFFLPKSLRIVDFENNRLTIEAVEEMFGEEKTPNIVQLAMSNNKINLDGKLAVFPRSVMHLNIKDNFLKKIGRNDLKKFAYLKSLSMVEVGLKTITRGAFDHLKSLRSIEMDYNQLSSLPSRLFQNTSLLHTISASYNRLESMPDLFGVRGLFLLQLRQNRFKKVVISDVPWINHLDLSWNLIESCNISTVRFIYAQLSNNRLRKIEKDFFSKLRSTSSITLHSNEIQYIHVDAFQGFRYISELFLQRNKLKKLPAGIFKGISIKRLFLFDNELETFEGLLEGMKRQPEIILLFGNNDVKTINKTDFKGMPQTSQIFVSCSTLEEIPNDMDIKPKIFCSPSIKLKITTNSKTLEGFKCRKGKQKYYHHCEPCQAGFYSPVSDCYPCPAGAFYQDEMAAIACKPCPLGQFVPLDKAPGKSALECLTCPAGTNTNSSAAYRACQCLDGYARTHRFGTCTKCTQNGFSCRQDYPELRKGYWMTWQTMRSAANVSCKSLFARFVQNLNTYNDTYDRAAIKYDCHLPTAHKCRLDGSCLGGLEARCERGYTGTLCAVCEERYMKSFGKCVDCPSPVVAVLQCMALFAAFLFICWLMRKVNDIKLAGQGNGKDKKTFADLILSTIKILMGFYQVLVGIVHALPHIRWPGNLTKAVRIFEYIQFSILHIPALHCIKREWRMDAIKEFWFAISATAVVPLAIFVYAGTKSLFNYCCSSNSSEFRSRLAMNTKQCLEAIFLFLFATYPFTSSKIFQIQPASCHTICTSEQSGQCMHRLSFLRSDYHVSCTSELGGDLAVTVAGYAALILPLGFPLLLFILLWRLSPKESNIDRKDGPENDWSINGETASRGEFSIVRSSIRLFNGNYKPTRWYWEVTEMIRKLIISIAGAFLLQNIKIGLFGLIILSVLFAAAHAHTWPMKDEFDNWMQLLALLIVSVNLCFGATQNSAVGDEDILEASKDRWGLGIMLVSLNSLLLVLLLGRLIGEIIRKICQSIENRTCCCIFDRGGDGYRAFAQSDGNLRL